MTSHVVVLNPGSVVVAIAIVLACVAMLVFSSRRQWLHWEKCTAARLALSATGHHRLLTGYRCFIALYCIITLLWVLIDGVSLQRPWMCMCRAQWAAAAPEMPALAAC